MRFDAWINFILLWSMLLPTTACAETKNDLQRDKVGSTSRPYSEKIYLQRHGDDLYLSAKIDSQTDITYWFKRCMFNELYTFYRVGTTTNRGFLPTTRPDQTPQTILNLAYSDNIGPFAIAGCGWCGANHKYKERTARTAYNAGFTIQADNRPIETDTTLWANTVTVTSDNVILDPSRPSIGDNAEEVLREVLCHETIVHRINRNNIEVSAAHRFCNPTPVTVAIYYGMQSMFEKEYALITPQGAYPEWTPVEKATEFTYKEYPLFRRYLEKSNNGYQSTFLLPNGLGEHTLLSANDVIFINAAYGKTYHKLIADKSLKNGDEIRWKGVYTWFRAPLADNPELLCYEGVIDGCTAIFMDCKKNCDQTIRFPAYIDLGKSVIYSESGAIKISNVDSRTLHITSKQSGGCILLIRE